MPSTRKIAWTRCCALLLSGLFSGHASAFLSSSYFPLVDGATWTYVAPDGVTTQTRSVVGTKAFSGAQVKVVRDQAGSEQYLTNDSGGLRFYGALFADSVNGNQTDFYNGPAVLLAVSVAVGMSPITFAGTFIEVDESSALSLNYNSSTTVVGIESITVAAGTFANALHVRNTISYFGSPVNFSRTLDMWLAPGVGLVREVSKQSTSLATTTWELQSYSVPDLLPDSFSFAPKTVDLPFTQVISDPITVSGIVMPVGIEITGGSYQVNGGPVTNLRGIVNNGDTVRLWVTAAQAGLSAGATAEIGGVAGTFAVTTTSDTTPDPFSFPPITGAPPGVTLSTRPITITGINTATPISIVGGEYSMSGTQFTSAPSTILAGRTIAVRLPTAPGFGATTSAILTIGGASTVISATTLVPDSGPLWELYYSSEPGAPIGGGRSELLQFGPDHPETSFEMLRFSDNSISVRVRPPSGFWSLNLGGPGGSILLPGRYENAVDYVYPFNGAAPGLDLSGDNLACGTLHGRFDILEVAYAPGGEVERLAVNVEQHCELQTAATFAQVRFNSTIALGNNTVHRRSSDFSGDGYADILWRNASTGQNYLYPLNGTQVQAGEGNLRTVADMNWKIAGTGDFDGDGKTDILWRNMSTGENYIYLMNGISIISEAYVRTVADQNWQVAGVGDFDGDGRDDILWRNRVTGENYLYPMVGTSIKPNEGYLRAVADLAWQIAGIGDFDGDGKADILWRNNVTGANYVYPMDGTAIKSSEGYLRTVADTAWRVRGVGDFDGDGKADIAWRNSSTGENYLYLMDGTTIKPAEGYIRTVANLAWDIAAVADYDGDGRVDILWRNAVTGENYIYPMDGRVIKATEGFTRTIADPAWQAVR